MGFNSAFKGLMCVKINRVASSTANSYR